MEGNNSNSNKPVELVVTGANQPPPAELKKRDEDWDWERVDPWAHCPTDPGLHCIEGGR